MPEFLIFDGENWISGQPNHGQLVREITRRLPDGTPKNWEEYIYQTPKTKITIAGTVNGGHSVRADLNEEINYTISLSDKTFNSPGLTVSVVDRANNLLFNLKVPINNGEGNGTFTVTEPIDYMITNQGINYHKEEIPHELVMEQELVVRGRQ